MSDFDEIRDVFFEECADLLESLEANILALDTDAQTPDTIDAIFRAVHSIKGGAGTFRMEGLVDFTHSLENILIKIREGNLKITPYVVAELLEGYKALSVTIDQAHEDNAEPTELPAGLAQLTHFQPISQTRVARSPAHVCTNDQTGEYSKAMEAIGKSQKKTTEYYPQYTIWNIDLAPYEGELRPDIDLLLPLLELERHCEVHAQVFECGLPSLDQINLNKQHLRWHFIVRSKAKDLTKKEIGNIFKPICRYYEMAMQQSDKTQKTERFITKGGVGVDNGHRSLRRAGESIHQHQSSARLKTVRVSMPKIDVLTNLAEEMTIAQSKLESSQLPNRDIDKELLRKQINYLGQITRELCDHVCSLRAQPLFVLHQRMKRVAREAAFQTGKSVQLICSGGDLEIDRSVLERLTEPLTQIIQNAIDHGIESEPERQVLGKSPEGTVWLSAERLTDRIVLIVRDDGKGLNKDQILATKRTDEQQAKMGSAKYRPGVRSIFEPGFSTAQKSSKISGRGMGMSIVREAVQSVKGQVRVTSEIGSGCKVEIELPLTLNSTSGILVEEDGQPIIIPTASVVEVKCLSQTHERVNVGSLPFTRCNGRLIPILRLQVLLRRKPLHLKTKSTCNIIIVLEHSQFGLIAIEFERIIKHGIFSLKPVPQAMSTSTGVRYVSTLRDGIMAVVVDPESFSKETIKELSENRKFHHKSIEQYGQDQNAPNTFDENV